MISVVVCSVDAGRFGRVREEYARVLAGEEWEVIGVHDAKGMCEGYNRGLGRARGEIVVFSHDDIEIWQEKLGRVLRGHLARFEVVGVAGTSRLMAPWLSASPPPYVAGQIARPVGAGIEVSFLGGYRRAMGGMQALDGVFLAFRREAIEKLKWDEETFKGFHGYDMDVTFRAHLAGMKVAAVLDVPVLHASPGTLDKGWDEAVEGFKRKHGGRMGEYKAWPNQWASVLVPGEEEAKEVMRGFYEGLPE